MLHLFKLINTIDNDDTLTIYIEEKDYSDGIVEYLGLKFENGDIKQMKIQKLKLIEPDEEELDMPSVKFSSIINLPATDFQKIIIKILEKEDISVAEKAVKIDNYKALPDDSDSFINMFVNSDEIIIKNETP